MLLFEAEQLVQQKCNWLLHKLFLKTLCEVIIGVAVSRAYLLAHTYTNYFPKCQLKKIVINCLVEQQSSLRCRAGQRIVSMKQLQEFLDIFLVLACHYPLLDGFDQHFQASVHFPLTSAVNKSQQHGNKFSGMLRIKPGAAG